MKKSKLLALLLAAALLCGAILPGLQVNAADGDSATGDTGDKTTSGVDLAKSVEKNEDGTYTIRLEAYATGDKVISEITEDIPTDVILVLDQSGSMDDDMGKFSFEEYKDQYGYYGTTYHTRNQDYYEYRHNGGSSNLWYKLGEDNYVSVSVTIQEELTYSEITNGRNEYGSDYYTNIYNNRNNLYAKVDGKYQKVTVTRQEAGRWDYRYIYTLPDGTEIANSTGWNSAPTISGTDDNKLYLATVDSTKTVYTYTYTDKDRNEQTIGVSTGADTVFSPTLYKRTTVASGTKRITALKSAAQSFVDAVAEKAKGKDGQLGTTDDVAHRIAVVGFASESGYGNNTELLSIRGRNSGTVGIAYNRITDQNYIDVLQDMSKSAGQTMVNNAVNALAANGATRIDLGMTMAKNILEKNPLQTDEKRNRVVIVFTDGSPTNNNGFEKNVANSAITTANEIKAAGTTVYSIGVFSGADATSAGTEPSGNLDQGSASMTAACNWFMQKLSSNNGTPQSPSYYLSAGDTVSLNNIFKQISDQIESGGSSTTLNEDSVIRDVITPQFEMENGAATAITVEKWDYHGTSLSDKNAWTQDNSFDNTDVKVSIDSTDDTDKTTTHNRVNVSGFDFATNYAGTETKDGKTVYRGSKLVIKFKIKPRDEFLGGNEVITNADGSGIYENEEAEKPLGDFEKPDVDVKIKDLHPEIPSSDVYLGAYFEETVTKQEILNNATVIVGGQKLDLSMADANYGLPEWITEYVDIKVEVTTSNDDLSNLKDDVTYTLKVTITPKKDGTATGGEATADGKIRVFKPVLDFQDSTVYYGDTAPVNPADFNAKNLVSTRWYHEDDHKWSTDDGVTMLGKAPNLTLDYTAGAGIDNGKIATKQDIPVTVKVSMPMGKGQEMFDITDFTTFNHAQCSETGCAWKDANPNKGDPAFLLHVKTCTLEITKAGGADGEPYVFDIYRDGEKYTQATIVGNNSVTITELPVGTYTVQEDMGWSWRYDTPAVVSNGANLISKTPSGSILVTNTIKNRYWLNGYSDVVANTFSSRR